MLPKVIVGEFNDETKTYTHKKDINRTKIYGLEGFKSTVISEDDYDYKIKDNYYAVQNGIILFATVIYKGDKDEVTFEELEGRRYYFRKLTDMIISTQQFNILKELK